MQPTLVILAAGMASRYGSRKQTQSFGPSGETILEYSIYDAIRAGFGKAVFIIREDFAEPFKAMVEPKLKGRIATDYVYQDLSKHIGDFSIPAGRTKPWGTAHALLCCQGHLNEPFAIINADDFYGRDAFVKAHAFLTQQCNEQTHCIIGYGLNNTLSDNGTVSRGLCTVNAAGLLTDIQERTSITRNDAGIIVYQDAAGEHPLPEDSTVSMNFFCYAPGFVDFCAEGFREFLLQQGQELKSEYYLPSATRAFIEKQKGVVQVIPTEARWFGVTYQEDAPEVERNIRLLVEDKQYPDNLWAE
ncbi:MAG: nucleotidyltransferase [Chitinophagaceae bacterium]|nr:nucleotidyltransferase [Chitinophagaceae bacterium]